MDINEVMTVTSALMQGFGVVALLFFAVLGVSIPLGLGLTLLLRVRFWPVRWLVQVYIYVMRATPLMLQLFFIYFGLPYISRSLTMSGTAAALLGFGLNYAAYFAEIFRGGLMAVDKGQNEAAQVLGYTKAQTLLQVILPQMFRVTLPSITNEAITLVKDTALVFSISVPEIIHYAKVAVSRTGQIYPYIIAFCIYLILNTMLQMVFTQLEKRLKY